LLDRKTRLTLLAVLILAAAAAIGAVAWYRSRPLSLTDQLKHLPTRDAAVFYVDFAALRSGGVLQRIAGARTGLDPDYVKFIEETGLDYQRDLTSGLVAISPSGNFMMVSGRFDWPKLRAYAQKQGGGCRGDVCHMQGSTPERRISFFPLQDRLMALAVSTDEFAAERLRGSGTETLPEIPDAPVWISLPSSSLQNGVGLPTGTRMFASSLSGAEQITLSLHAESDRFTAKLNVRCSSDSEAAHMADELTKVTGMLRDYIAREKQTPNPADLSGVLTSGSFRSEGKRVAGQWPIQQAFLENLLAGAIN
jgi:hypothetical protein